MRTSPTHAELLLAGRWLPLTRTIVFIEQPADVYVETFIAWRGAAIARRTGCAPEVSTVRGSLDDALGALLPLTTAQSSKYLIIPTAAAGWTALIENIWTGTEGELLAGAMARLGHRTISVSEAPHTLDPSTGVGWWGERRVTLAVPAADAPRGRAAWTVGVRTTDSGRWEVATPTSPPPFTDPTDHSARRVQDRFTHAHLLQVTAELGLRPTDPAFFMPDGTAFLIERTDPRDPSWFDLTLEQAYGIGRPAPR